ncbi:hypothetical protein ABZZ36_42225 [Actinacidiphila glaucinigra]|uniref:hypothetical protein n=1 Tax=Actinacidiphila glaucinigra TaxID=235986 RepID=UPI0033B77E06
MEHRTVAMPPSNPGGRVVWANDAVLGTAYRVADLLEFLRRAGINPDIISLVDEDAIEWRGAGADMW